MVSNEGSVTVIRRDGKRREDEIGLVAVGEIDLANLRRALEAAWICLVMAVEVGRTQAGAVLSADDASQRFRQRAGRRCRRARTPPRLQRWVRRRHHGVGPDAKRRRESHQRERFGERSRVQAADIGRSPGVSARRSARSDR